MNKSFSLKWHLEFGIKSPGSSVSYAEVVRLSDEIENILRQKGFLVEAEEPEAGD